MRTRSKDRKRKGKAFIFKPKIILAIGFFVFLLISFTPQYFRIRAMNDDLRGLRHELSTLEKQNHELKKDISKLGSDSVIEEIAREELGMVKPGEEVLLQAVPGQVVPLDTNSNQHYRD